MQLRHTDGSHGPAPHVAGALLMTLAAALLLMSQPPARADVLIVSSTSPALRPGTQIADTERLELAAGVKVRILLPSGATLSISGPASRLIKDVTKGEPIVETVWAKMRELLTTGGVDESRPGATRSATPGGQVTPADLSWSVITANANGNVCVENGARIALTRPPGGGTREMTLVDTAANARAKIVWTDNTPLADWPATMSPSASTVYQALVPGQPPRQLRLRLVEKADTSEDTALRTLLVNDCRQQARLLAQ